MASLICDSKGSDEKRKLWRISFIDRDGERKTIRPGKMTEDSARDFLRHVENLIGAMFTGDLAERTAKWAAGLDDATHKKLARVGLVLRYP